MLPLHCCQRHHHHHHHHYHHRHRDHHHQTISDNAVQNANSNEMATQTEKPNLNVLQMEFLLPQLFHIFVISKGMLGHAGIAQIEFDPLELSDRIDAFGSLFLQDNYTR